MPQITGALQFAFIDHVTAGTSGYRLIVSDTSRRREPNRPRDHKKRKRLAKISAMTNERLIQVARIFLRACLSVAFFSAIADRFGLYGPHGAQNVGWGDWTHFLQYVAQLNWFMPKSLIPTIGAVETVIEFVLAVSLLAGFYQRITAWASAALLTSFALTMTVALGFKAPLGRGVFTAIGGALLLGAVTDTNSLTRRTTFSKYSDASSRRF
jgi:putative oxidoreductase